MASLGHNEFIYVTLIVYEYHVTKHIEKKNVWHLANTQNKSIWRNQYFDNQICSWRSNRQIRISIGAGNGLVPDKQQTFTWTNDDRTQLPDDRLSNVRLSCNHKILFFINVCNLEHKKMCAIHLILFFTIFLLFFFQFSYLSSMEKKLEWAANNGNRYPPYPQVMATAISQ